MLSQINNNETQVDNAAEKNVMSLYVLEYKFIPQLVERYHKEQVPVEALLDLKFMKEWLLSHHCSDFAFDFNDFTVKYKVIDDNHAMIVYTFPEPYKTPLAKYGAILLVTTQVP